MHGTHPGTKKSEILTVLFDVLSVMVVVALGSVALAQRRRTLTASENRLMSVSFAAHMVSASAMVWITTGVYGSGDMTSYYFNDGAVLARVLAWDFWQVAPGVLKLIFQDTDALLPIPIFGTGSSTGSMTGLAGFLLFFTGGSFFGACTLVAVWSFSGKAALYRALRAEFPSEFHERVLIAVMLMPSVVFWSCGVIKESVAIGGLGWLVFGAHQMMRGKLVTGGLVVLASSAVVALIKPYLLFPFVVGLGVWWWRFFMMKSGRRDITIKPIHVAIGAVLAVGGVVLLGELFPKFKVEKLAENVASQQALGQRVEGGSNYEIGNEDERSFSGQLVFAPVALGTALFRPLLFEVRGVMAFINALETSWVLWMFVRMWRRQRWRGFWAAMARSPVLTFCLVFVVCLGVAVGLSTANLGTLSRYRMPLMPFFCVILMVLTARLRATAARPALQEAVNLQAAGAIK
jgi:hypothetical protein